MLNFFQDFQLKKIKIFNQKNQNFYQKMFDKKSEKLESNGQANVHLFRLHFHISRESNLSYIRTLAPRLGHSSY